MEKNHSSITRGQRRSSSLAHETKPFSTLESWIILGLESYSYNQRLRYDIRNLLDDLRLFSGPREIHDDNFLQESSDMDDERFEDLDSDEEILFDMDEDERREHLEQKRLDKESTQHRGIQYSYGTEDKQVQESTFQLHFDVPERMAVPDSEKVLALIERTARFVNNSSEPTMEIILQAKQATNPNFGFLSRRHHLHAFYKHVRWLLQTGLYETAEEVRLREAEEAKAEQEEEARRIAETMGTQRAVPHPDLEKIIAKTIEFLNPRKDSTVLEAKLLSLNDPRFEFMKPGHAWNQYYTKMRTHSNGASAWSESATRTDPTDIFLTHLENEEQSLPSSSQDSRQDKSPCTLSQPDLSSKEARAAEMRRLDRLQRVKELLKLRRGESDPPIEAGEQTKQRSRSESRSKSRSRSHSPSYSRSEVSEPRTRRRSSSRSMSPSTIGQKRARQESP